MSERPPHALKRARLKAGMTQAQLGEALHVSNSLVSMWESGTKSIAETYREPLERLFGNVDEFDFYTPPDQIMTSCVVCGRQFIPSPGTRHSTCSDECRAILLQQSHFARGRTMSDSERAERRASGQPERLKGGYETAMHLPGGQSSEQHRKAKVWVLIDPSGNRHEVSNLRKWCKENAQLFGKTEEQADSIRSGFAQVAKWMRGKTARKVSSYMGWTLEAVPYIRELPPDLSALTYPAFQKLRTEARNYPDSPDGCAQLASDMGIDATESALHVLELIRNCADGGLSNIRGISELTREEFADRYRLPIRSVTAWETKPIGIPAWAERMLAYIVVMDRIQSGKSNR